MVYFAFFKQKCFMLQYQKLLEGQNMYMLVTIQFFSQHPEIYQRRRKRIRWKALQR